MVGIVTRQKPASPRLQVGHPLAQNLLEFYCLPQTTVAANSNAYVDVVNPNVSLILAATTTPCDTDNGPGLLTTGVDAIEMPNRYNYAGQGQFSIQFIFIPLTFNTVNSEFLSKNQEFDLFFNNSTGNCNLITIGGGGVSASVASTCGLILGQTYIYTVTKRGSNVQSYCNGRADITGTTAATTAGNQNLKVNGDGNRGAIPTCKFISWAFWNRKLSADEVTMLTNDPYAPIRPRARVLKSSGVTSTIYSRRTLSGNLRGR